MPEPTNTLLIEGPFEELAEELAQYLDNVKKTQSEDASSVHSEVMRLLEQNQKDEALKRLVTASIVLNSAPEKEFIPSYNLLIHLLRQSPNFNRFLPKVCQILSSPITSSPVNGPGMALSILTTIFNVMQPDNDTRYHVFLAILSVVRANGLYESLRPQLKNLDRWIAEWDSDEDEQQRLFLGIADVAADAGEEEESYLYLLRALRIIPRSESSEPETRSLALRALRSALTSPSHFDFQDLTSLDPIQSLRRSDPIWFDLLEIFAAKNLDDYEDFCDEHDDWFQEQQQQQPPQREPGAGERRSQGGATGPALDASTLHRKIRLLTLAGLAASTPSRSLPYGAIAKALRIPAADVEMWVIDVIRAGLVEGKLSQLNQTFLVHRSTYRVFGERQWREVATRLDTWRESLKGVLHILRTEREHVMHVSAKEARETEGRINGAFGTGGGGGGGGGGGRRAGGGAGGGDRREMIDVGMD